MINWVGSTVYVGCTFSSTSNPINIRGINFNRFIAPTVKFDYNAKISIGGGISPQRLLAAPTNLYDYHAVVPPALEITETDEIEWFGIDGWTIEEIDDIFWSLNFWEIIEADDIVWDVSETEISDWTIDETDETSWVVKIDNAKENCLTGDGEIEGDGPILLPMIW